MADDAGAVWWNPAGLGQVRQSELMAGYSALFTGITDYEADVSREVTGYHQVDLNSTGLTWVFPAFKYGVGAISFLSFDSSGQYSEKRAVISFA